MKLAELEAKLGVQFPARYHEIYETGAMKWLEMTPEELKANRMAYIADVSAFLMINCGCEPYLYDEIPAAMDDLRELLSWTEKSGRKLRADILLIPFGHENGDFYCFSYQGDGEPAVICIRHDAIAEEMAEEYGDFASFFYLQLMEAAENEEDIKGANYQAQAKYLSAEYAARVDADALSDDYEDFPVTYANIWAE